MRGDREILAIAALFAIGACTSDDTRTAGAGGEAEGEQDVVHEGDRGDAPPAIDAAGPGVDAEPPGDALLLAAGDITSCERNEDEMTAAILDQVFADPLTVGGVATLGDNAYPDASTANFADCYAPTWGRHYDRTRPSLGNHDYTTPGAAGYFEYFGDRAGLPGEGYYSYDLGAWHIVVLNSNCAQVAGGCGAGSPQEQWLRADLAANPSACTLAYWHNPRYTSGYHGNDPRTEALWQALYDADADVVLTGHDHTYQRYVPMNATGQPDPVRGIRSFIVGTGGRSLYAYQNDQSPHCETRHNGAFGVLQLTLKPTSYDWKFLPVGSWVTFEDEGSAPCH